MQYSFSKDSNIRYLPFMYFLPSDLLMRCPTLRAFPRCFGDAARSDKFIDLITSDNFLKEIMDAAAALVFPHFGFGGWIEHYTGYFPPWKLAYALPIWCELLEKETGWGVQKLFQFPSNLIIPPSTSEYAKGIMARVVKRGIEEQGWQPILDTVREMPCEEDFENWDTNVRKDFLRKWYHTRSKRVQTVSLEACMEDEEHGIHEIEDTKSGFEDSVIADDFCRRFKARLSDKDLRILELRVEGFTYEEIAVKLGYKNHSGVLKRMKAITKMYLEYEDNLR